LKKFFKNIAVILNILAAFPLLLCIVVPSISPNTFWPLTFIGLGFLFWVILNILFIIYWLLGLNKWILLSVGVLLINLSNLKHSFGTFKKVVITQTFGINVATLNTQLFGYFQEQNRADELISSLKEIDADVLCLQEFLELDGFDLKYFKQKLGFEYAYFKVLNDGRKKGRFGMATFSKYPIQDTGYVEFDKYTGNMGTWVQLLVNEKSIKVFNVHLQSIRFSRKDYKIIQGEEGEVKKEDAKALLKRIKIAATERAKQAAVLKDALKDSKEPVLLCGDFNDPPVSYTYGQLADNLKDAYTQSAFGIETTYTGPFPAFRIDYILHHKDWSASGYKSIQVNSDHKLVTAKVWF